MDSLQNYAILQNIGDGNFASVKLVRRLLDGKLYAMKSISFTDSPNRDKKNALNQVRLLASLEHQNIIAFKSTFFDEETQLLYVVMEYAENGDLAKKIEQYKESNKQFDEQEIWKFIYEASKALKLLNEAGIIHRDIKPANIVIGKDGKYKLADMNVSRRVRQGQLVSTGVGTPLYLSPQIWKREHYDYKTDIWSLGAVVYQMAALQPPFPANTIEELKKVVRAGKYKRIPACYSDELNQLISLMLNSDTENRPGPNDLIAKCLYRTLKPINQIQEPSQDTLLQTILWQGQRGEVYENLPKPQYEDEGFNRHKSQSVYRQQAKSFRMRTRVLPQMRN